MTHVLAVKYDDTECLWTGFLSNWQRTCHLSPPMYSPYHLWSELGVAGLVGLQFPWRAVLVYWTQLISPDEASMFVSFQLLFFLCVSLSLFSPPPPKKKKVAPCWVEAVLSLMDLCFEKPKWSSSQSQTYHCYSLLVYVAWDFPCWRLCLIFAASFPWRCVHVCVGVQVYVDIQLPPCKQLGIRLA